MISKSYFEIAEADMPNTFGRLIIKQIRKKEFDDGRA